MVDPSAAFEQASAATVETALEAEAGQTFVAAGSAGDIDAKDTEIDRGSYKVIEPPPPEKPKVADAPAAGKPDPGSAKDFALQEVTKRGWGYNEFTCLVNLWNKESGWNVYAHNVGSGAYGIPQSLPGEKMASVGSDWKTNAETQIKWGLQYIEGRYGTPCGAWDNSVRLGFY